MLQHDNISLVHPDAFLSPYSLILYLLTRSDSGRAPMPDPEDLPKQIKPSKRSMASPISNTSKRKRMSINIPLPGHLPPSTINKSLSAPNLSNVKHRIINTQNLNTIKRSLPSSITVRRIKPQLNENVELLKRLQQSGTTITSAAPLHPSPGRSMIQARIGQSPRGRGSMQLTPSGSRSSMIQARMGLPSRGRGARGGLSPKGNGGGQRGHNSYRNIPNYSAINKNKNISLTYLSPSRIAATAATRGVVNLTSSVVVQYKGTDGASGAAAAHRGGRGGVKSLHYTANPLISSSAKTGPGARGGYNNMRGGMQHQNPRRGGGGGGRGAGNMQHYSYHAGRNNLPIVNQFLNNNRSHGNQYTNARKMFPRTMAAPIAVPIEELQEEDDQLNAIKHLLEPQILLDEDQSSINNILTKQSNTLNTSTDTSNETNDKQPSLDGKDDESKTGSNISTNDGEGIPATAATAAVVGEDEEMEIRRTEDTQHLMSPDGKSSDATAAHLATSTSSVGDSSLDQSSLVSEAVAEATTGVDNCGGVVAGSDTIVSPEGASCTVGVAPVTLPAPVQQMQSPVQAMPPECEGGSAVATLSPSIVNDACTLEQQQQTTMCTTTGYDASPEVHQGLSPPPLPLTITPSYTTSPQQQDQLTPQHNNIDHHTSSPPTQLANNASYHHSNTTTASTTHQLPPLTADSANDAVSTYTSDIQSQQHSGHDSPLPTLLQQQQQQQQQQYLASQQSSVPCLPSHMQVSNNHTSPHHNTSPLNQPSPHNNINSPHSSQSPLNINHQSPHSSHSPHSNINSPHTTHNSPLNEASPHHSVPSPHTVATPTQSPSITAPITNMASIMAASQQQQLQQLQQHDLQQALQQQQQQQSSSNSNIAAAAAASYCQRTTAASVDEQQLLLQQQQQQQQLLYSTAYNSFNNSSSSVSTSSSNGERFAGGGGMVSLASMPLSQQQSIASSLIQQSSKQHHHHHHQLSSYATSPLDAMIQQSTTAYNNVLNSTMVAASSLAASTLANHVMVSSAQQQQESAASSRSHHHHHSSSSSSSRRSSSSHHHKSHHHYGGSSGSSSSGGSGSGGGGGGAVTDPSLLLSSLPLPAHMDSSLLGSQAAAHMDISHMLPPPAHMVSNMMTPHAAALQQASVYSSMAPLLSSSLNVDPTNMMAHLNSGMSLAHHLLPGSNSAAAAAANFLNQR